MKAIVSLVVNTFAVFLSAYLLPGVNVDSIFTALVVAIVLGIANTLLRPILILLTLPVNIVTLGLFIFVINGILILLTSAVVPGFFVQNFWWAILFSLVLTLISWFLSRLSKEQSS